jgi:flagellar biogenesis protein FliO
MTRISGRWAGIGIAILVVVALAFVAVSGRSSTPPRATVAPVYAENGAPMAEPATPTISAPGVSFGSVGGLILKFGIVAAILAGSLWAMRRFMGGGSRTGGRTNAISIADTIMLAQGRALYVVDVGDRAVLIGATPQQFSALAEITDATLLEKLRTTPERPASLNGIAARLETAVRGLNERRQAALAARLAAGGAPGDVAGEAPRPRPRRTPRAPASFAEVLNAAGAAHEPPHDSPSQSDEAATVRLRRVQMQRSQDDTAPAGDAAEPDTSERLRALAERLRAARESA